MVAIDINTGKMKWYFQAVHHDLWDMDLPPAPPLLDVTVNGKRTPILAQTGKLGYMFLLNRETGQPVFGVKETPVAQSKVPGEHTSPTQPIPVKPPELARHSFKMEDLVTAEDTNEAHAKACRELVEKSGPLCNAGPFTPWVYRAPGAPPASSVIFPGAIGGTDWGGESTDPKLGYVFVNTSDYASIGWIEKMPDGSRVPYDQRSVIRHAGSVEVLGSQDRRERRCARRAKLAVPETAMGPFDRGERGHRRHRLAGAAGRHR